jgi:hypothetical protein
MLKHEDELSNAVAQLIFMLQPEKLSQAAKQGVRDHQKALRTTIQFDADEC